MRLRGVLLLICFMDLLKESQNVFLASIVMIIKNLLIPRSHGSWRHNKE